ncbi:FAD:protein FMN transferase [Cellulophaga sp. Hel_I_12]|uniref:FAD:protein FMN transferase n=1 Tax=Cellulophaga sp. Hel_I_12 TaxID=1249972 RepID=UPI001E2A3651|nr:FAD:protein FMN transferase [Cellulophaga sp. Hel_I_12]
MKNILLIMMDLLKFKVLRLAFGCVFLLNFSACSDEFVQSNTTGMALGTSYSILFFDTVPRDFQREIDSVFRVINKSMSTYIPDSDISKINAGDSTIVVDAMFEEVFNLSKHIHETTNGYFDPTVGILVNAWGFGPGQKIEMDSIVVDSLLNYVGFEKVMLLPNKRIRKADARIVFDFNAVAKGYAVDRLGALLEAKGIHNYLVEVGGELVTKGENKIKNKKFVVGIDDPLANDRDYPAALVYLNNKGLASSGNYRHFREDESTGKRYVHTVDPITGYTKDSNVLGVTILAVTCMEADAYATAFMVMDLVDTMSFLSKRKDIQAFIIYIDTQGEIKEFTTDGFKAIMIQE